MTRHALLIGCALLGAAAAWQWRAEAPAAAPALSLTTIDGEQLSLPALRGRPVLVTFWASDCRPCLAEMPHLADLYRRFQGAGFALVGVAMPYDQPAQVLRLVAERQPPYPIVLDPVGRISQAFGRVRVTPTSYLISPDGDIVDHQVGPLDLAALESRIRSMLRSG